MPGLPKRAADQLVDSLNRLPHVVRPDELTLRRFEQEAQRLMKTDAVVAHEALGAIAGVRGDIEKMREHHRAAIALAPANACPYSNFAVSLMRAGFYAEAADFAGRAYDRDMSDPQLLAEYIANLMHAGLVERAAGMSERLTKLQPDVEHDEIDTATNLLSHVQKHRLAQKDTCALMELATTALHEHGVFNVGSSTCFVEDDESERFVFEIAIDGSPKLAAAVTSRFAELVAESDVDPGAQSSFSVTFAPYEQVDGDQR